jgi:DNA-binding NarL/FixJ family response regulator
MIRITVVDDHRIIYDGIKAMLIGVQDIAIADYVSDLSALSYSIDQHKPDIILMDIVLPSGSGIDATKEILTEHPDIKIIVLSSKEDEITIGEAIRAGAKCYLHKDTGKEELIKAIRFVNDGFEYFGDSISKTIYKSYVENIKSSSKAIGDEELSEREKEIVVLLCKGLSFKEIASALYISTRTVESHKKHISEKLKLRSTAEIVRYAIKHRLIDL